MKDGAYLSPCGKPLPSIDEKWEHIRSCAQCKAKVKDGHPADGHSTQCVEPIEAFAGCHSARESVDFPTIAHAHMTDRPGMLESS